MSTESAAGPIAGPSISPGTAPALPSVKALAPTPAPEAPKQEVKASDAPKEDPFSSKFAALSRKEKALLEKELGIKEKEAKFSEYETKRGRAKTEPLAYLKDEYGLSLDDLIKLAANDNHPTPEMLAKKALDEVETWKKQQTEEKKKAEEEAKTRAQKEEEAKIEQTIYGFKKEIGSFLESNSDKYELTKNHDEGAELIYNVILKHHQQSVEEGNPRVMSIEEAAESVEKWMDGEIDRYMGLKKLQLKVGGKRTEDATNAEKVLAASAPSDSSPKTLTNALESQTPPPSDAGKPMTLEESKRRSAAMLKWTRG
jgi:hypothetical protein